jgi:hypothetical protein
MSNTTHAKRHAVALAIALGMTALSGHATAQTTGAIPIQGARLSPAVLSATGVEAPPKR